MARLLLLATAFVLVSAGAVLACSCMRSTPEEALARSTVVFEGRVVAIAPFREASELVLEGGCATEDCETSFSETTHSVEASGFEVRFSVTRQWKGVSTEEVVVRTASDSAACGYAFEAERDYVVYASRDEGGTLFTGLCDRTALVADASEDLAFLGTGDVPVDVADEPARETPTSEPPARGGCASCSASSGNPVGLGFLALSILTLIRRRR